jgi:hypothetical protein
MGSERTQGWQGSDAQRIGELEAERDELRALVWGHPDSGITYGEIRDLKAERDENHDRYVQADRRRFDAEAALREIAIKKPISVVWAQQRARAALSDAEDK